MHIGTLLVGFEAILKRTSVNNTFRSQSLDNGTTISFEIDGNISKGNGEERYSCELQKMPFSEGKRLFLW